MYTPIYMYVYIYIHIYIYIYIYIYRGYLINCEYFNNLNEDGDMMETCIMAGISTSPSPYPIEKIGDSPYLYPYLINAGILRQNRDGFGQYPRN